MNKRIFEVAEMLPHRLFVNHLSEIRLEFSSRKARSAIIETFPQSPTNLNGMLVAVTGPRAAFSLPEIQLSKLPSSERGRT